MKKKQLMNSIEQTLQLINEEFSIFSDPKDKYVYLIDLGKENNGISFDQKNKKNKIQGCTSQAWVIIDQNNNSYSFKTDSDAMIVKGLLSLIGRVFNGFAKEDILSITSDRFLSKAGLHNVVSSQRTNGFGQAINKIQRELED